MDNRKVRVAVVGLNMGRAHAHAFSRSPLADLRWVVDLDEGAAQRVAQEVGCNYATDWSGVLGDVDAVSLCVPHHLHYPMAMEAIEAGKHVLVEKPMANTEGECLDMIRAADERGVKLMVAHVNRFRPAAVRLKQAVESGEFGRVISLHGFVEGYLPPAPGSWFSRKDKLGGGVLFSHGCHDVDFMVYLLGMPKRAACVGSRIGTEWMEGEGTAHAVLEWEEGAVGSLSVSWGLRYSEQKYRLQVHTTDALLLLNTSYTRFDVVNEKGRFTVEEERHEGRPHPGVAVSYEIDHFLRCVIEDRRPLVDGREALKSLRVIWSMYQWRNERSGAVS